MIQNFLSIGNDTIEISFQDGLNLITGNNIDNPERRNGCGKSAIIEAFYYGLFGSTIRDIKKEFIVNNVTKGKGRIELVFDITTDTETSSYKIIRQLKPSTVELYKLGGDNDQDISKDSIINTNKYICDLIGSNAAICKSCDILSLSDNIPFMAKKPEEKRKFIEDIFALEVFGKMLKELKEYIKENKSSITVSSTKVDEITNSINSLTRQYDLQKKEYEEKEDRLNSKKNDLNKKIEDINSKINAVEFVDTTNIKEENNKLHDAWNKIDKKIGDLLFKISNKNAEKKIKDDDFKKSSNTPSLKCDKCLQNIPESHVEHIKTIREELHKEISDIEEELQNYISERKTWESKKQLVQQKLGKNQSILDKNDLATLQLKNYKTLLNEYNESLENLDEEFKSSNNSLDNFYNEIEQIKDRHSSEMKSLDELNVKSSNLDVCKFILGEEGVKSFIIKRLLEMLNSSIQKYISDLGMSMKCKFDEYFEEQITNEKGKDISYWNFSGGERRTVDLACAWAFKDIKRKITGVSSNVEFMDEIFDSAFDERGLDLLIQVLKNRIDKNNLSCYAISHRKETLKHVDGEIVTLEKENGITKRINDM